MKFMRLAAAALLTLSVAAGCGSDDTDTASGGEGEAAAVTITDQWARTSPAGAENGAVYMTLRSADGDTLTGVAVDASVAAKAEIHETMAAMASTTAMGSGSSMAGGSATTAGGGMMSMKPIDELELPKGTDVTLEPGGYHIMLLDLAEPLAAGEKLKVTLTFAGAGTQEVEVPVRDAAP